MTNKSGNLKKGLRDYEFEKVSPHIISMAQLKGFEPTIVAFPALTSLNLPLEKTIDGPSAYVIGWKRNGMNLDLLFATNGTKEDQIKINSQGRVGLNVSNNEFIFKLINTVQTQYDDENIVFNGSIDLETINHQDLVVLEELLKYSTVSENTQLASMSAYKSPEELQKDNKILHIALGVIALLATMGFLSNIERIKREKEICMDLSNGNVPVKMTGIQKFKAGSDRLKVVESFAGQNKLCQGRGIPLETNPETIQAHQELVKRTILEDGKLTGNK